MQTIACNAFHSVAERSARWILTLCERTGSDSVQLTQEYLALMLGVSRPSVSIAASTLSEAGLIRYVRGRMTVCDRAGLEAASCECFRALHLNGASLPSALVR